MEYNWFKRLKVVEFASVLAGPLVGTFLAELGAEVIKIENPRTNGDVTRSWKLPSENPENKTSAYFHAANWGKEHITLDLREPRDLLKAKSYVRSADIVISNFTERAATSFGLNYEQTSQLKPGLIQVEIRSFAETPERPAYDVVLQAESGFLSMMGTEEGTPCRMPVAMIDMLAAHQAKEALLIALLKRETDRKGSRIRISLEEAAIASLVNQGSNYLNTGIIPGRIGILHPNIAPYGETVVSRDQEEIVLAVTTDKQFGNLCDLIKHPDLKSDIKYASNSARVANRARFLKILRSEFRKHTASYWRNKLIRLNIPFGSVLNLKQVFEMDTARNLVRNDKSITEPSESIRTSVFDIQ